MNFVYSTEASTEADALYIELEASAAVARTVEVSPGCLVDLNAADRPIGIELIHPASSYLSLIEVVGRWHFDRQQRLQLGRYPYFGFTPRRRSGTHATVRFTGRSELLTCA